MQQEWQSHVLDFSKNLESSKLNTVRQNFSYHFEFHLGEYELFKMYAKKMYIVFYIQL